MLTDDDQKNAIIASVAVLSLIMVCAATIGFYKSVVAEHVDRNTINITEDTYAQALAKWQAQHIADYEITLASGQSEATLRVSGGGAHIDVIGQTYRGSEESLSNAPGELAVLRQMTFEARLMICRVGQVLPHRRMGRLTTSTITISAWTGPAGTRRISLNIAALPGLPGR
jgi:hypothetical protein